MSTLNRRVPLTIVFVLFVSVGTASADCAWVLWSPRRTCEHLEQPLLHKRRVEVSTFGWQTRRTVARPNCVTPSFAATTTSSAGPTPWTRVGRKRSDA